MSVVTNYKCPQCGAPLAFSAKSQKWDCEFCLGSFVLEDLQLQESTPQEAKWNAEATREAFSQEESSHMRIYNCPQCGAQMMADETSVASACPYCGNLAVFTSQVEGAMKPEWLIPFQKTKEEAATAFRKFCKGKHLLPKRFLAESSLEKLSGVYVPFWMFDCDVSADIRYNATQETHWEDEDYRYTKIDYYALRRKGSLAFADLPVDGSTKMDDELMGAVEPYHLQDKTAFDGAYLSGFLAEKYDQTEQDAYPRAESRITNSTKEEFAGTAIGYSTVHEVDSAIDIQKGRCQYAMMPVWLLSSRYEDKVYTFAMNGQTGKFVGDLPVSVPKAVAWFMGLMVGFTGLGFLITALLAEMGVL